MKRAIQLFVTSTVFAGFLCSSAVIALATPAVAGRCSGWVCHPSNPVYTVTATLVHQDAASATYDLAVTGPSDAAWAVFSGTSKVAGGDGLTGRFCVNLGQRYELYAVGRFAEYSTFGASGMLVTPNATLPSTATPDPAAPVVTSDVRELYQGPAQISITALDEAPGWGVAYIGYRLDGGSARLYRATGMASEMTSITIPEQDRGVHSIQFWAQDRAGNLSASQEATFTVKSVTALSFSAPATCEYGSASVSGRLLSATGKPVAGKTVEIWEDVSGWKSVASVKTGTDGVFSAQVKPRKKTAYRATFEGDEGYIGHTSATAAILPKAQVTRVSSWSTLRLNKTYYATGKVAPAHSLSDANKVTVRAYKRGADGAYRYVMSFKASYIAGSDAATGYKAAVKFTKASQRGVWRLRAYHAADADNAAGYSSYDTVKVE